MYRRAFIQKSQVFQVNPPLCTIKFPHDIDDAITATKKINCDKLKEAYFYSVGLNYWNVKKYYNIVLDFEKLIEEPKVSTNKKDIKSCSTIYLVSLSLIWSLLSCALHNFPNSD